MSKQFNLSMDINAIANNPLEAAKWAQAVARDRSVGLQFYVQDDETKEIFSVDLEEEDSDAVLSIKANEYTPVIETPAAYNIFLMVELARVNKLIDPDLEYDKTWCEGINLYNEFEKSEFNTDNGLYECIEEFISDYIEKNPSKVLD